MKQKSLVLTLKKKLALISLVSLISILLFSCEEDQLSTVGSLSVSQGTYVGLVKITWDPAPNAQHYNLERMNADGNWAVCGSTQTIFFYDYGLNAPGDQLQEGVKYKYRVVSGSSDISDSDPIYSDGKGWIHEMDTLNINITKDDNNRNIVTWQDLNMQEYNLNIRSCYYVVKRKYEDEDNFSKLGTSDNYGYPNDAEISYTDYYYDQNRKASYQIIGYYQLTTDEDQGNYYFHHTFPEKEEGGNEGPEVAYNITNLGAISGANNAYGFVALKNISSVMYAATITNPAIGKPAVYKLNGSSWDNISNSYPSGLLNNFENINIAGDGTKLWVAGVSDSAYVYEYNNGWSSNLMASNMGLSDTPDNVIVEYQGNKLYALVYHDNKLELYTYAQDTTWNLSSTIESNADISEMYFKTFNGMLYASYLISNSSYNSTLKIKHLNGSSWQNDLDFTHDYLMNICVRVDFDGTIYFSSESQDWDAWIGNVFEVTSSSSANELVPSTNTWLLIPGAITFDNEGNLVTTYIKVVSANDPMEVHLAAYENNEWKEISNDYTNHISPADIESLNGVYYVYGDGLNLSNGYPLNLNTQKLTK